MSPIPEYDTYLALKFDSVSQFLSCQSHLEVVSQTAATSSRLLISIKTPPNDPTSPWSTTGEPSSSSSSSSTATATATGSSWKGDSPPPPSPTSLWLQLEQSLASIYSEATRTFLDSNRVLARVDVVLDSMRNLSTCPPPGCSTSITRDFSSVPVSPRPVKHRGEEVHQRESYQVVAMGGTFDHLHAGHKILLTMASSITTRKLIVGVSDEELLGNKKFRQYLEPIRGRINHVERFLQLVRPTISHQVVPLKDVYGPTATDSDVQAIVVSEETRAGGKAINTLRAEKSFSKLDTFVINLVSDDGSTSTISNGDNDAVKVAVATKMGSTGIREWIASREVAGRNEYEE